ncbi:hypothetical protein LR48_Vigan08g186400 [Vigna angularis]|uniref:ABC-type xenobiotic transporter n=1 Tax=Phaseolus angularis TaxID=3914 RepID=A0A0L9V813_PHAAN|nr:hypothetical protein LR48_Vigan08g186400 [Vigna angularis]
MESKVNVLEGRFDAMEMTMAEFRAEMRGMAQDLGRVLGRRGGNQRRRGQLRLGQWRSGEAPGKLHETEKEMVSIERTLQYMDIPQEEQTGGLYLNQDWPNQGFIEFQCVTLKYLPSLPAALCNLSFRIAGGTQVGIIGRTGAGKSSVLNALFCLIPICTGSISIDGVDIKNISVRELRTHFAIVRQSPFLFEGSLKCHVKEEVEAAGGLDLLVKEGGMSFSVGQRQLLCLARALLKSSKVLYLNEWTANVDIQTVSLLQITISGECKGMTVLTITHRISTVLNMDNILILDHGKLAEQGNPQVLLKDAPSYFLVLLELQQCSNV